MNALEDALAVKARSQECCRRARAAQEAMRLTVANLQASRPRGKKQALQALRDRMGEAQKVVIALEELEAEVWRVLPNTEELPLPKRTRALQALRWAVLPGSPSSTAVEDAVMRALPAVQANTLSPEQQTKLLQRLWRATEGDSAASAAVLHALQHPQDP